MTSEQTGVDATRRTRLANERTFLAWWRTALGAQGLAVAVGMVLPELTEDPHAPYIAVGLALALLGSALGALGWWRYRTVDRALRGGEEAAAPGWLVASLSLPLAAVGLVIAVLVVTT